MIRTYAALGAGFILTVATTTQIARADPPRVPATLYPAGAHIAYRPAVSNEELDCMWGFECEMGIPLFHVSTQDQLHRVSGWAQFAGAHRHRHTAMAFELFVSCYAWGADENGVPWSTRAYTDLAAAVARQGYHSLRHAPHLLSSEVVGEGMAMMQRSGKRDLIVMAVWAGATEVEGIVEYDHGSSRDRATAIRTLGQQVSVAAAS